MCSTTARPTRPGLLSFFIVFTLGACCEIVQQVCMASVREGMGGRGQLGATCATAAHLCPIHGVGQ